MSTQLSRDNLALPCQRINDRPSDDRHIECHAIFDLRLERIGRIVIDREPRLSHAF